MTCGIYLLSFNNDNNIYIGKSKNIEKRFKEHVSALKLGNAAKKLQQAYSMFGYPEMHILESVTETALDNREQYYIQEFDAVDNGLNTSPYSNGGGSYGDTCSSSIYSNETYFEIFKAILTDVNETYETISKKFSVSKELVTGIASGTRGKILLEKHFPEEYKTLMSLKGTRTSRKNTPQTTSLYTEEQYVSVVKLLTDNIKYKHSEISDITGVSVSVIRDINSCRRHKWLAIKCPDEWNLILTKQTK
jgi:group I intron endonuclease